MTAKSAASRAPRNISREFMTGAVMGAALLLFVGTGGTVLVKALAHLQGSTAVIDPTLITTMLLNVSLILFGWFRYRALAGTERPHRSRPPRAGLGTA